MINCSLSTTNLFNAYFITPRLQKSVPDTADKVSWVEIKNGVYLFMWRRRLTAGTFKLNFIGLLSH
jgi:hypothetical protein